MHRLLVVLGWCAIGFFASGPLHCQIAKPLIRNLSPKAYDIPGISVSPQNWAIAQHKDGRIFLANTSLVLIWDGEEWEGVAGTENLRMFKFAEDGEGRIFTGGIGDLGYIAADTSGKASFVSLKSQLPDSLQDFQRVYRVDSQGDKIFFLCGRYLFVYRDRKFQAIVGEEDFIRTFVVGDEVFVTSRNALYKYEDGELKGLPEAASPAEPSLLRGMEAIGMEGAADGVREESSYLLVSKREGLSKWSLAGAKRLNPGLDSLNVFNVAALSGQQIGIGTQGSGFFILNQKGEALRIINEESGLPSGQVPFPYQGKYGGIWLSLYNGFSRVDFPSSIEYFSTGEGINDLIISLHDWQGDLFIGTTNGPFLKKSKPGHQLQRLPSETGEVWGFFEMENELWMAALNGLYRWREGAGFAKEYPLDNAISHCQSTDDPRRLYVQLSDASFLDLEYREGKWMQKTPALSLPFFGNAMSQAPGGNVWLAGERLGYIAGQGAAMRLTEVDSSKGLPPDMGTMELATLDGRLLISGEAGIYQWSEAEGKLLPFEGLGPYFQQGRHSAYNITQTRKGDVWITSDFETGLLRKLPDGNYALDSVLLQAAPISDYFAIYEDPQGITWLGGTEGLLRFDPVIRKDYQQDFHALIRRVSIREDSVLFHGTYADSTGLILTAQPAGAIPTLPYADNQLSFRFAAPFFEAPEKLVYSHQLLGLEAKWTPWSRKTETQYTNLREGSYTFQVRARNAYGTISRIGEYRFTILPPWYRTTWAYIGYAFLSILSLLLLLRLNTRRLLAAKRRLEGIVEDRTREIQRQVLLLEEQKELISAEKEKSEGLLLNILPKSTSEELKEKGSASPRDFPEVTVLFTDFKGFTMIAEQLTPQELVDEIHECFSEFDRITRKYGIEKIKTIGDAYMAAGGLPEANSSHPIDVVTAALEIRDYMRAYKAARQAEGKLAFEIRLGVHTGPVVAGVVGLHKFQYDIWGDAVNLAARTESSGEVGKVNVSQATRDRVKDHFACSYRGKVKAKNKGEVEMYFVEWKQGATGGEQSPGPSPGKA